MLNDKPSSSPPTTLALTTGDSLTNFIKTGQSAKMACTGWQDGTLYNQMIQGVV